MKKEVLLLDIDEVVARTICLVNNCLERVTGSKISYGDWKVYEVEKNSKLTQWKEMIYRWFINDDFLLSLEPITGAVSAIRELSEHFRIFFASNRKEHLLETTILWLESNGFKFEDVFCLPDKRVLFSTLRPKYYVEDSLKNLLLARKMAKEFGIKLIVNDRPWNKMPHQDWIIRCRNWKRSRKNSIINTILIP